jgi:hypothetical protein
MTRTSHDPGYYLALTFGTLLSSQGADAQKVDPRGLRLWRLVRLYAVLRIGVTRGVTPRLASRPRGAGRTIHHLTGPVHGVPHRPRKLSIPTVNPGRPAISRTAKRTPGMKEARS